MTSFQIILATKAIEKKPSTLNILRFSFEWGC